MKKNTKILIGFLSIILFILIQMCVVYKLQTNFYDNTLQIKEVEAPLELMSEQVLGYDAMLTEQAHTSLLHAQKGEYEEMNEHKEKYNKIGIKLDDLLKRDAKILLEKSRRTQAQKDETNNYLNELDRLNLLLVDLETRAFIAMEKNDTETAYSLIIGEDYHKYKEELYQDYLAWASIEHSITGDIRSNILKESQLIIYLNLGISIGILIVIIITLLVIRSFVVEKSDLYKSLYDNSNDALMTLEPPNWNFTSGNPAALKMFNAKNEKEFDSFSPDELSPKKQPDGQLSSVKAKKMIDKAMKEGSAFFEWTHKAYKGKDFPANVLLSRIREGGKTYLQATVRKLN